MAAGELSEKDLAVLDVLLATDRWLNAHQIEQASEGKVTAKTARKSGDALADLGLIESKDEPRGKGTRPIYRMPTPTPATFAAVVESYFASCDRLGKEHATRAALSFLTSHYARQMLTRDFVRGELVRRRVEMRRMVRMDQYGRRAATDGHMTNWISVHLPVAPSEDQVKPTVARAVELIEYLRYPQQREALLAFIEEHYADDEPHRLVLPILALMQVSQGALREFVSDWKREAKPDNVGMSFNEKGLQMVEPVLFRMIYAAVADLAAVRAIPKRMDATWATVCPEPVPVREPFPRALLEIQWRQEGTIGYWAGFVAQEPFTTPQVTTWWRSQAINGPPPPSQR